MRKFWFIFLSFLSLAGFALACSTPVFRYAIERWEADPYRLMIFTDGELTASQEQTIKDFKKYERYGFRQPPLIVESIECSELTNLSAKVWAEISTNCAAPSVALLYPPIMRDNSVIWVDELTSNALNRIVMSPARLETATRLLAGEAAVWLMIRGDDPEENQTVRNVLEAAHRNIENSTVYNEDFLQLVKEAGREPPELRFSVLEVDPTDPREAVLMAMLPLRSLEKTERSSPIVVPVFGQGRAVVVMINEFIADKYIERVAEFLTGACSCEVKALNPGFDILIPIDWVAGVTEEYVFDSTLPPLTGTTAHEEEAPPEEILPVVLPEEKPEEVFIAEKRLSWNVLSVCGGVVLAGMVFTGWLLLRKNR